MIRIKPLSDRVLVEREALSDKTDGGIILTSGQNSNDVRYGRVIEVAKGKWTESGVVPAALRPGQRVLFGKYAGVPVQGDLVIMREDEVLGIVVEDEVPGQQVIR